MSKTRKALQAIINDPNAPDEDKKDARRALAALDEEDDDKPAARAYTPEQRMMRQRMGLPLHDGKPGPRVERGSDGSKTLVFSVLGRLL